MPFVSMILQGGSKIPPSLGEHSLVLYDTGGFVSSPSLYECPKSVNTSPCYLFSHMTLEW